MITLKRISRASLLLASMLLTSMVNLAHASANPLSVHVLNLDTGLPAAGVTVLLEKQEGERWQRLHQAKTDNDGRIRALFPDKTALTSGVYRVTFRTGDWFAARQQPTFFPEVPVIFVVDGSVGHYHIPLLLSPYGYSTYRGN